MDTATQLPPASRARWITLAALAVIVLAGYLAYRDSFSGPFVWDDISAIPDNPTLRSWSTALHPPVLAGEGGRPLLNLSFALNYAAGGTQVGGYHLVNLLIHLAAACVLFGLVGRTLMRPRLRDRFGRDAPWLALTVALLWVVHPLQTESVTFVSERAESLMGLFYLLTLYSFARALDSPRPGAWLALSVAACWLGALSKEVMATAPLLVLLYDRTFAAGSFGRALRRRGAYYAGLAGIWALLALLMTGTADRGVGFGRGVSPWTYLLTSCRSIILYLKLAFWPHPLVFFYGTAELHGLAEAAPYAAAVAALAAATFAALRWRPAIGFGAAWIFLIVAPTTSFIPIVGQPMAENRFYLPLAGVIALVLLGLHSIAGRRSLALALAVLPLAWLTTNRNRDYGSAVRLWSDTAKKVPADAEVRRNLGLALMATPGRIEEAIAELRMVLRLRPNVQASTELGWALALAPGGLQAGIAEVRAGLRVAPDNALAHDALGMLLTQAGRPEAAIREFEASVRDQPDLAEARNNLANALAADPAKSREAEAEYRTALRIKPYYADAHRGLGALLLREPGRLPEAIAELRTAIALQPDSAAAYTDLGWALANTPGNLERAIAEVRTGLRRDGRDPFAHNTLGMLLQRNGQLAEAKAEFETALRLKPDFAAAHLNLAGALARDPASAGRAESEYRAAVEAQPDYFAAYREWGKALIDRGRYAEAASVYERAVALDPASAVAHDGFGISLARTGRYPEAVAQFRAALRLEPSYSSARLALGLTLAQMNRTAEASAEFRTILANPADPNAPAARRFMALVGRAPAP
ncbi:MAG: tetratricopeptide repeat protein [Opitutaceae bacterium]